jgi:hypothetical protein
VPELKAIPAQAKTVPVQSAIPVAQPTQPTAILNPPAAQPMPSSAVPADNSQAFKASQLRNPVTTQAVPSLINRQSNVLPSSKFESKVSLPSIERAERPDTDRRVSRAMSPVTPNGATKPAAGSANVD